MRLKRLFKGLFERRVHDRVGNFIKNIPTIDKLMHGDYLYVDAKKPHVILSIELHIMHIDDELKLATFPYMMLERMGIIRRDSRYCALMENILAYINFKRAILNLPVVKSTDKLNFLVMNLEKSKPILVGYYQHGKVDYDLLEKKKEDGAERFALNMDILKEVRPTTD